jgi:hypothetical protein
MTLPELIIGLAVMSMILLALSAFTVAVGQAWVYSNQTASAAAASTRTGVQLDQLLRNSLDVAQVKNQSSAGDTAHVFFWRSDNIGAADTNAALGEMALLEYNPTNQTLWLYASRDPATYTTAESLEATNTNWGDRTDPAVVTYFKQRSFLDAPIPVVGTGSATTSSAVKATAAKFDYISNADTKPVVVYDVSIVNPDNTAGSVNGSITLRNAQTPAN